MTDELEGLEYRAEVYKNIDGKVISVHVDDYLHLERRLRNVLDELSETKKDVTNMERRALDAEAERDRLRRAATRAGANLIAAISLLQEGGRLAAPSDKMFNQMLEDYRSAVEGLRAAMHQDEVEDNG